MPAAPTSADMKTAGGFTPSTHFNRTIRGESAPPGKSLFGNFSTFGFPFDNFQRGSTWVTGEGEETERIHERMFVPGLILNLVFWLLFSAGSWYVIGRFRRQSP